MKKAFTPEEVWLAGQLTPHPRNGGRDRQAGRPRCGRGHRAAREPDSAGSGRVARKHGGGRRSERGNEGREEVPAAPVHGRLVRGRHAPPGQGVRRAVRAVHHRRRGRARLRPAAGAARAWCRTGARSSPSRSSASPISTSTPTSSGTSASSSSRACARGSRRSWTSTAASSPMKRCGFVGLPPQTPLGETVLDREEAMKLFDRAREAGARPPGLLRLHHVRGRAAVHGHVQLLLLLLRDLPRPEAGGPGPVHGRPAEVELPRRHRSGEVHRLRRLHQAVPGGVPFRGPKRMPLAYPCGVCRNAARQVGGRPGQVHRLRRLRDRAAPRMRS